MQAALDRRAHRPAEIDARDRPRRARRDVAVEGERESRTAEQFLEPRGDEADHARLPAIAGGQDEGALFRGPQLLVGLAQSLLKHLLFQDLPLAVETVQLRRDGAGLQFVAQQHAAWRPAPRRRCGRPH